MAKQVKWRRGNTAQHSTFVGVLGEITINTDTWGLRVHDGATAGGHIINVGSTNYSNANALAYLTANDYALKSYVDTSVSNLVAGAPGALNTLSELANALGNNASFSTTITNSLASITGNVSAITNGTALFGNIIPSANVTYSLGNVTHQWKDLWVSNNTIYINSVPLSIDAGGNLLINGAPVSTAAANLVNSIYTVSLASSGHLTVPRDIYGAGNDPFVIQNTESGVAYLELPLDPSTEPVYLANQDPEGNLVIRTGDFGISNDWEFNFEGTLNTPSKLHVGNLALLAPVAGTRIAQEPNETLEILTSDASGTMSIGWSQDSNIAAIGFNAPGLSSRGMNITTGDFATQSYTWKFTEYGETIFPTTANAYYRLGETEGGIEFSSQYNFYIASNVAPGQGGGHLWYFKDDGDFVIPGDIKFANGVSVLGGGITGNIIVGNGAINFIASSSGDGNGFSTIEIRPDDVYTSSENYLIIDPTSPNHIHIRAGGTQDNSQAELYLGGENSYFKVNNGADPDVSIAANNYVWSYGVDGNLTFPDSTVQTTAWTGNTRQIINGTSTIDIPTAGSNIYVGVNNVGSTEFTVNGINTLNLVSLGNVTAAGNISGNVSGYAIGYRDVPQVSAGNVTLGLTDAGKHYYSTAPAPTTLTIPSNANVAFPIGTAITVVNAGTGNINISKQVEANLYLAGNSSSATRTLTSYGMATLLKTATNEWFINGTGLV